MNGMKHAHLLRTRRAFGRATSLRSMAFGLTLAACGLTPSLGLAAPLSLDTIDPAPAGSAPLLRADAGITAIAGRVLATDGARLAGVVVTAGPVHTRTDSEGRFLLAGVPAGALVVTLDGRKAGPEAGASADYGYYEMNVAAEAGRTIELPYVDWLPRIDHTHDLALNLPLNKPAVVTTPAIPSLELRLPAGAVLTDPDGKPVTHIGLTAISTRRPPFPLPRNVEVPIYFTAQPGGSVISSADGTWLGAQVVYPNYYHQLPRARQTLWTFRPDDGGWTPYGAGTVTADGRQVVPDPEVRIYALDGAMMQGPNAPPCTGPLCPKPDPKDPPPKDADPVDLASGSFDQVQPDFRVSDILPIGVTRSYTSADTTQYSFGAGMSWQYDIHLWSGQEYQNAYLVLPGGSSIYYTRTPGSITNNCGVGCWSGAVFTTTTPGIYYNSTIVYNGNGWNLTRLDGMVLIFGDNAPLAGIKDRFGNKITITRAGGSQTGQILQISSPNGRNITPTYTNGVITSVVDNLGRTFTYGYDPTYKMLQTVTDPNGGVTTYTWNTTNYQVQSIKDPRGNTFITNTYDSNLRVHQQTLADNSSTYTFNYTLGTNCTVQFNINECNVVEDDVTDPNGNVRKVTFDPTGYQLTDDWATGTSVETDITYCRAGDSNAAACPTISGVPTGYLADYIDGLGRDTHYQYDSNANVTNITYLFGTAGAASYGYTYSPSFNLVTSVTDPLGHATTTTRPEPLEEATAIADALGDTFSFTYNGQGQAQTLTDAVTPANTTSFTYDHGDLVSTTDPLGRTTSFFTDAIGRRIQSKDPLGNTWGAIFDAIDGIHQSVDPVGSTTTFNFDADGHISSVVNARSATTSYAYTARDQVQTRTDPVSNTDQYTKYDANGNLLQRTDRNGHVVTYTYDQLNRVHTATYADSAVTYTWDKAGRLTQIADTAGNTLSRFYDGLNNMLCETPGSVTSCMSGTANTLTYTYDLASRIQTMTVAGQPQVVYTFDNANRLKSIVQGSNTVSFAVDADGRRTGTTLPDGITATNSFDAASQVLGITYTKNSGATTVGTLSYTYDLDGRAATRAGTLFQSILPAAVTSETYDLADRLTARTTASGTINPTWDNNGNLTNDGSAAYTWDDRNRLSKFVGAKTGQYTYDSFGRRLSAAWGATTTSFLYDRWNVTQEQQAGVATANEINGLGLDERYVRTVVSSGVVRNFLPDLLGSTMALAGTNGNIQTNYAYDPYGVTTVTGTADTNPFQFTGRENDPSGLYYYRHRYYQPAWGRFVSQDPIRLAGGINLYKYAFDSPTTTVDPTGKIPGIGTALGAIGGAISGIEQGLVAAGAQKLAQGGCLSSLSEAADIAEGIVEGAAQGAVVGTLDPVPGSEIYAGAVSVASPGNLAAAAAGGAAQGIINNPSGTASGGGPGSGGGTGNDGGGSDGSDPTKPTAPTKQPDSAPTSPPGGGGGGGCN